ASDLGNADPFLGGVLGATLASYDYFYDDLTGIMVPRVFAVHPLLGGDDPWFWAYGGCPYPENFNLVQPLGALTEVTHAWEEDAGTGAVAGVLNRDPDGDGTEFNAAGHTSRAMLNAFSYGFVRDGGYGLPQGVDYARAAVGDVLTLLFEAGPTGPPDDVPEAPGVTRFAGAWPNPFNPATTVRFSLAEAGPARVTVHDVAGRLVRTLHDGPAPAGTTELVWDGRDEKGTRQASGVYLLRFRAASMNAQRKLVLLK
ncbi:MAG: T9SS type A sorting domain-containing protein, partial [Candidatus Krumholzibacteriota bacterium]|nr:T9SS type A sorting domain-containing protein [Candidatus Krumholzibacteriota bacterium]